MKNIFLIVLLINCISCTVVGGIKSGYKKIDDACVLNECVYEVSVSSHKQIERNKLFHAASDIILEVCESPAYSFEQPEEEIVFCPHCKKSVKEYKLTAKFKCY